MFSEEHLRHLEGVCSRTSFLLFFSSQGCRFPGISWPTSTRLAALTLSHVSRPRADARASSKFAENALCVSKVATYTSAPTVRQKKQPHCAAPLKLETFNETLTLRSGWSRGCSRRVSLGKTPRRGLEMTFLLRGDHRDKT